MNLGGKPFILQSRWTATDGSSSIIVREFFRMEHFPGESAPEVVKFKRLVITKEEADED